MKETLHFDKYFLSPSECTKLLTSIYSVKEKLSLFGQPVIDGSVVSKHIPSVTKLIREIQNEVDAFAGIPLVPLSNSKDAIRIHFTEPHLEYSWHYDPNVLTAVIFLNQVEGGEVDVFDDYRILLDSNSLSSTQRLLDRVLNSGICRWLFSSKLSQFEPSQGGLLLMHANRCLHSIRKVRGRVGQVRIEFAFDVPGITRAYSEANRYYLKTA
jgi:hypothetical protein